MHRPTVDAYNHQGLSWADAHRHPGRKVEAERFARTVDSGSLRIDIGCGAGRYVALLGKPVIGMDASSVMLDQCRSLVPDGLYVQADVEALPFVRGSLGGAWSEMTHHHLAGVSLPMALWDLHRVLAVGAPFELQVLEGDYEGSALVDHGVEGSYITTWMADRLEDVVVGSGFTVQQGSVAVSGDEVRLSAVRARTLADTVGPDMRLLICGLNPSLTSADAGVGFFGSSNRF